MEKVRPHPAIFEPRYASINCPLTNSSKFVSIAAAESAIPVEAYCIIPVVDDNNTKTMKAVRTTYPIADSTFYLTATVN